MKRAVDIGKPMAVKSCSFVGEHMAARVEKGMAAPVDVVLKF